MRNLPRRLLCLIISFVLILSFSATNVKSAEEAKKIVISSGTSSLNDNVINIINGEKNYIVNVPINAKTLSVTSVPADPKDNVTITTGGVDFPLKGTFDVVDQGEIDIKITGSINITYKVTVNLSVDREVEYLNAVIDGFEKTENGSAIPEFMVDILKLRFAKLSNSDQNRITKKSLFAFVISSGMSSANDNNVVFEKGVSNYVANIPLYAKSLLLLSIPGQGENDTITVTSGGVNYPAGTSFPAVDDQVFEIKVDSAGTTTIYNITVNLTADREVEYLNAAVAEFEKPENGGVVPAMMLGLLKNRLIKLPMKDQLKILRKELFGIVVSSGTSSMNDNFVALVSGTTNYTINVPLNAKTLSVVKGPFLDTDTITITSGGKEYPLKGTFDAVDESVIEVKVVSGVTTTTYKLTVNLSAEREVDYLNLVVSQFQLPTNGGSVPSFMIDILKARFSKLSTADQNKIVTKPMFDGTYVAPVITLSAYATKPTNKDIVVSATASKGTLNSTTHTFTSNNYYDFKLVDEIGNIIIKHVAITNIDKVAPLIQLNYYNKKPTNKNITVKATTNEGKLNANIKTFLANGKFTFIATDLAGNETKQTVTINNIDKVSPKILVKNSKGKIVKKGATVEGAATTIITDKNEVTKKLFKNGKSVKWPARSRIKGAGNYRITAKDQVGNASVFEFKLK